MLSDVNVKCIYNLYRPSCNLVSGRSAGAYQITKRSPVDKISFWIFFCLYLIWFRIFNSKAFDRVRHASKLAVGSTETKASDLLAEFKGRSPALKLNDEFPEAAFIQPFN